MLHGVLVCIFSDRGVLFTTQFLKSFEKCLGSKLNLSTSFDRKTNCQIQRTS